MIIDRQAAIAAVIEAMVDSVEIMHAVEALEDLPSAQTEIIRCKDCANAQKCHGDVVMRTRSGGNLYCPLTFCSEGKRKDE